MSAPVLAFDLGAESGRAMLGAFDGARVELRELHRFPTRSVPLPDGLYWDALGLFDEILRALGAARREHGELRSVGIDSWAVDFGLLDGDGRLLANPLSYRDGRGVAALDEALARVPFAELYETTGIQLLPINTLFQLLALGPPAAAETLLLIPDLLGFWLTGERVAEATNASTTQLLDARSGEWSLPLIERFGLPARLFPPVVAPGTVRGGLLEQVAAATGLARSTPVVSVASHDTASAVVATPLTGAGCAFISSGTWSLVGIERPEPLLTDAARGSNLTNEGGFGGTTRLLKNVMGLWLLQECRRAWAREGRDVDYASLAPLAEAAPSSGLFDPDLPELLAPGDMPARIAGAAGVDAREVGVVARSIFESLACKYRLVLEQLEAATGATIRTVHVIGGGAQNAYLCRLAADVTGRVVVAGPVEASALGNVLVQLHAFGDLASLADMRDVVRASTTLATYEPGAERARWDDLFGRFAEVVQPRAVAT
jgi:rhamnulokinase